MRGEQWKEKHNGVAKQEALTKGKYSWRESLPHGYFFSEEEKKEVGEKKNQPNIAKSKPQIWICASSPDHRWLTKAYYIYGVDMVPGLLSAPVFADFVW